MLTGQLQCMLQSSKTPSLDATAGQTLPLHAGLGNAMRVMEAETMAAEQQTLPALESLVHKVGNGHRASR